MADKRKMPELLAPAGDMERLKMAVLYGQMPCIWLEPPSECGPSREIFPRRS